MQEPRDIKNEFFEISKLLKEASVNLEMLVIGAPGMAKKVVNYRMQQSQTSGGTNQPMMTPNIRKPELLVKTKKFNQMEMEMDKFLAKKQQISHTVLHQSPLDLKHSILQSILHLSLKSLYEYIRLHSFSLYGYQQVQCDVYYLFTIVISLIPYEEAQAK